MSLPRPAPSAAAPPTVAPDRSRILPLATLTVLGGLLLLQVFLYGSNLPYIDEWNDTVPVLTGQHPINLHWLWSPWNGHRIFLPRLALLGALTVGHGNFRAGCFLNALTLIAAVALLLRSLSRRSTGGNGGGLVWTDALLPILFLNWGTQGDVLWPFEIQFALTVLLVSLILATLFRSASPPSQGSVIRLLATFLLLPLCGLNGLLFVPLTALWLAATPFFRSVEVRASDATAIDASRSTTNRFGLWLMLLIPIAVMLAYFIGLPPSNHPVPTPARFVSGVLSFLQMGWGITSVNRGARPFSATWISGVIPLLTLIGFLASFALPRPRPPQRALSAAALLIVAGAAALTLVLFFAPRIALKISAATMLLFAPCLLTVGGIALLRFWRDFPQERYRTSGMASLYLSSLLLALAVAFGRGGDQEGVSLPHYTILSALAPCIAYFLLRLKDSSANRRVRALLFFWVLLLLPVNMNRSQQGLTDKKIAINEFNSDMAAGLPVPALIGKNLDGLLSRKISPEQYETDLLAMRATHTGRFERLNDYPDIAMLFRNSVPLTEDNGKKVTLPVSLSNKIGSVESWRFSPALPGAMAYIRFTEVTSPNFSASTMGTNTGTRALAKYNVVWHRLAEGTSGNAGGYSAPTAAQQAVLYGPDQYIVEKVHDSVFYVPYNVDGISIVCTSQGTPFIVTKISVVPIPTSARTASVRLPQE